MNPGNQHSDATDGHTGLSANRRAKRFFDHAASIADSDHDRSMESYLKGLLLVPEDIAAHKALRSVSLNRMNAGGKPLGMFAKRKYAKATDPIEKIINAETIWAHDPNSSGLVVNFMEAAVEANMEELAYWAGQYVLAINHLSGKPHKDQYIKAADLFEKIGAFDRGARAMKMAIKLGDASHEMYQRMAQLESKLKSVSGWKKEEDLDVVETEDDLMFLSAEGGTRSAIDAQDRELQKARLTYEKNPNSADAVIRLAEVLVDTSRTDEENEAIRLLNDGLKQFRAYRFKEMVGDIHIKRLERERRKLRKKLELASEDMDLNAMKLKLRDLAKQQLAIELREFSDRVKHRPKDFRLRIDLARRLSSIGKNDQALVHLKAATADPQHRAEALAQMARCHATMGEYEASANALRNAVAAHHSSDDKMAIQLRYELMIALADLASRKKAAKPATEALRIAADLAQNHASYRDINKQHERIAQLVQQLNNGGAAA